MDVDGLMQRAYGASLVTNVTYESGAVGLDFWFDCWNRVVHLRGLHYHIPGGAVGRKYVDMLNQEIMQLAAGNYSAERLVVFSAVILQRDKSVKKSVDVRRTLERRMKLWTDHEFDVLMQEMERCDRSFKLVRKFANDKDHIVRVFTRMMLQGKVRAAVRWLSEESRKGVFFPSDLNEKKDGKGVIVLSSVWDILCNKHPEPVIPDKSSLLECETLPIFEEVEINGGHVLKVSRMIQGGAGPGGCDASHWQDSLLRYGAHSERLRESVASLCRKLANSIVPWECIKALMSSRLIALDKCPGVRPVGVGETLRRVIGKVVCVVTKMDAEDV